MIPNILATPLAINFVRSLFPLLLGALLGCWLGQRSAARGSTSIATIAGAIMGMLALIMGFTFSQPRWLHSRQPASTQPAASLMQDRSGTRKRQAAEANNLTAWRGETASIPQLYDWRLPSLHRLRRFY
jgi:hypothetical protein